MDTSINQDFRISELDFSEHTENKGLALKARGVIAELVQAFKPLFRYIASPFVAVKVGPSVYPGCQHDFPPHRRAIELGPISELGGPTPEINVEGYLFLDEGGKFFRATPCRIASGRHYHTDNYHEKPEEECLFQAIIVALQTVLKKAVEKRAAHLASIKERSEKLDEILAILKRPS